MSPLTLSVAAASAALAVLTLVRRPLHAALTVAWQLRAPLAVAALAAAAGLALAAWRGPEREGAHRSLAAASLAIAALGVLARAALDGGERAALLRRKPEVGPQATFHVLTHNCGLHRSDPARVAAFVADCGADVVALQELEPAHERALAEALRASHPHRVLHATGIDGLGLVSRFPITWARLDRLDAAHPYLVAELDAPGGPLRVVVFHPPAALAVVGRRHPAVRDLARLAREAAAHAPAVLLGDLNSTQATEAWDTFTDAGLVDVFRAVGRGAGVTFPVPFKYLGLPVPPLVRIDFVFVTPDLEPRAAEVGPPTSSDHLPLFATLARARATEAREGATRAS